jgi:uncharacterized membrane protein
MLVIYNTIAFGSPLTLSYQFNAFHDVVDSARPLLHMFAGVDFDNTVALLISGRGILVATPIVAVAVVGLVAMVRSRQYRRLGTICLSMFVVFVSIPLLWENPWGGDSPGPRYLASALPFLAPGVAYAWDRRRLITAVAAGWSCVAMAMATITRPTGIPADSVAGFNVWIGWVVSGQWAPTIPGLVFGEPWGRAVYLTASIASLLALRLAVRRRQSVNLVTTRS